MKLEQHAAHCYSVALKLFYLLFTVARGQFLASEEVVWREASAAQNAAHVQQDIRPSNVSLMLRDDNKKKRKKKSQETHNTDVFYHYIYSESC